MSHGQKSKRQRRLHAQIHPSNQSPLQWVFATPFSVFIATFGWNSALNSSVASVPAAHRLFVASCLSSSFFSSLIWMFIPVSLKGMESKITQSQNQSAKLATTKHITYTHLPMEKTHMHGRKESQSLIVKLSNAHRPAGKKSLTMQNCFKKNHGERKTLPHCTRCSQASLYGIRYP